MRRQNLVYVCLVLFRWQLVEQNYVMRANCVLGRGAESYQVRSEAGPGRLLLILLLLLFQLLIENLDKIDQSFLTESNLSFFFGALVHFDLNFLSQLVLILEQHVQGLDK